MKELKIWDNAPDFRANSTKGEVSLSQFKGKGVVLYFYPKDMTPGCRVQAQEFSKLFHEFKNIELEIIGVSRDNIKSHHQFCEREDIPYPLISDTEGKICKLYGVLEERSMFGKKYIGINRSTFVINPKGKICKIWKSVKPKGHAEKVLKEITMLKHVESLMDKEK